MNAADLAPLTQKLAQRHNIDDELINLLDSNHSNPADLLRAPRQLQVVTLCALTTTRLEFDLAQVLAAVIENRQNPKLAFCALVYAVQRLKTAGPTAGPIVQLLLMLDEKHMRKSPVASIPERLVFALGDARALTHKFPQFTWRAAPTRGDPVRDLARSQDPKMLPALKAYDAALKLECCVLWLEQDLQFMQCPLTFQYAKRWIPLIKDVVAYWLMALWPQDAATLRVIASFLLVVRPTKLEVSATSIWLELSKFVLFQTMDLAVVEQGITSLELQGRVFALDCVVRYCVDACRERLEPFLVQFLDAAGTTDIDKDPVMAILLVYCPTVPFKWPETDQQFTAKILVETLYRAPASSIPGIVSCIACSNSPLFTLERALPLVQGLSISASNQMLKLEAASLVICAVLLHLYERTGFSAGATQMRRTGLVKSEGLKSPWRGYFAGESPELEGFIASLCRDVAPTDAVARAATQLRRVTKSVLFCTINDTPLVTNLCGFSRAVRRRAVLATGTDVDGLAAAWSAGASHWKARRAEAHEVLRCVPAATAVQRPLPLDECCAELQCALVEALSFGLQHTTQTRVTDVVVSLSTCERGLLITRSVDTSALRLRVPLKNCVFVEEVDRLVAQSTSLSRSQFSGSVDEWWRRQRAYGTQLRTFLAELETTLFGQFFGMFSPFSLLGSPELAAFRARLVALYKRYLPASLGKVLGALDERVAELFLSGVLMPFKGEEMHFVRDLNCLVLDSLRFQGHDVDYDLIDTVELEAALVSLVWSQRLDPRQRHVVLIVDERLSSVPWESLPCLSNVESISRCLSLWHYQQCATTSPITANGTASGTDADTDADDANENSSRFTAKVFYVFNPDKDLKNVDGLAQALRRRQWRSLDTTPSEPQLLRELRDCGCYVYIGHGSGHKLIRGSTLRRADRSCGVMLFGCGSARLATQDGRAYGPIVDYVVAGCPLFVGFMWDVANDDCNRFTAEFLQVCFDAAQGPFVAAKRARASCKLVSTSLAAVVYGLP